jgi:hypothetical protein
VTFFSSTIGGGSAALGSGGASLLIHLLTTLVECREHA